MIVKSSVLPCFVMMIKRNSHLHWWDFVQFGTCFLHNILLLRSLVQLYFDITFVKPSTSWYYSCSELYWMIHRKVMCKVSLNSCYSWQLHCAAVLSPHLAWQEFNNLIKHGKCKFSQTVTVNSVQKKFIWKQKRFIRIVGHPSTKHFMLLNWVIKIENWKNFFI